MNNSTKNFFLNKLIYEAKLPISKNSVLTCKRLHSIACENLDDPKLYQLAIDAIVVGNNLSNQLDYPAEHYGIDPFRAIEEAL